MGNRSECELDAHVAQVVGPAQDVQPNAQNMNLSAACISRGGAALTTWPKSALEKSPLTAAGPKNCVWLKTLKASSRNCSVFDSDIWKDFDRARSVLNRPGP